MRPLLAALSAVPLFVTTAHAEAPASGQAVVACILAAGAAYRLPPTVLLILLRVEGGRLGQVSRNTNGTADIGPMQVNETWLPRLAAHWRATRPAAYAALRDDFCANLEGGAWILRQAIDEARGDLWEGVGLYHSHDPGDRARYLRTVLRQALRLHQEAEASVDRKG